MVLKRKSEENIEAAGYLINGDKQFCASSVHCSYYSCLQFIKHILNNNCGIKYSSQDKEGKKYHNGGSHNYLFHELRIQSESKGISAQIIKKTDEDLKTLKLNRKKADYTTTEIDDCAPKSYSLSKSIYSQLKEQYQIK